MGCGQALQSSRDTWCSPESHCSELGSATTAITLPESTWETTLGLQGRISWQWSSATQFWPFWSYLQALDTGSPKLLPKLQAQVWRHGQECPLGLQLPPSTQKCMGMAGLISPFLGQNLQVQLEVNFRSLRRKSGEWGRKARGMSVLSQHGAVPQLTKGRSSKKKPQDLFWKWRCWGVLPGLLSNLQLMLTPGPFLALGLRKFYPSPGPGGPQVRGGRQPQSTEHFP